jgi:hypothetical protein
MSLADYFVLILIAATATVFVLKLTGLDLPVTRGLNAFVDGLRRVRIWQVAIAVGVLALMLAILDHDVARSGVPQFLAIVLGLILFASAWVREFQFLMRLGDDDLPGRFDKPIWAFVLIGLAPFGLFLFRSYRLAHWAEPKPKPAAGPASELV